MLLNDVPIQSIKENALDRARYINSILKQINEYKIQYMNKDTSLKAMKEFVKKYTE